MSDESRWEFPTTDWSLLSRARRGDPEETRAPLEQLLDRYVPAMRRYLTRVKHLPANHIDELMQSFVADKLLDGALLTAADRQRGRFRSLLVKALEHYLVDAFRSERGRTRRLDSGTDATTLAAQCPGDETSVLEAFETEWAKSVLQEAVARTQQYCQQIQRDDLWRVLRCRIIDPAADGVPPPPYRELVQRFGYATPAEASNALLSAKRIFVRMLNRVLLEQAGNDADLVEELAELRNIFSRRAKYHPPRP